MLNVIGAGFGRTGTASLKAALERVGLGPCHHMYELIADPAKVEPWTPVLGGDLPDFDAAFDGYVSAVDWPGAGYWRELAARYPRAKVLLSVRDPDRWYDSVHETIFQISQGAPAGPQAEPDSVAQQRRNEMGEVVHRIIWDGTFGGRFADREHAIEVYERHNAEVRASIPDDRLLVYRLGDGWEPLCEFLGVPVPAEEFPHLNDSATIMEMMRTMRDEGRVVTPFKGSGG